MKKLPAILISCIALTSCATMPHGLTYGVSALAVAQEQQTDIVFAATTAQDKAEDVQAQAEDLSKSLDAAEPEVKAKADALVETATAAASATKEVTAKLAEQTKTLAAAQAQAVQVTDERDKAQATVAEDKTKLARRTGWIVGLSFGIFLLVAAIVGYIILRIRKIVSL